MLCAEIRRAGDKLEWSWKRGRSFSRAGQFHLKVGVRLRGGQRKGGWQAGDASAQVDIGIEAERRFWGLAALELNGVKLMAKLTKKKKLGSGKPYDKRSEKEAALNIPGVAVG